MNSYTHESVASLDASVELIKDVGSLIGLGSDQDYGHAGALKFCIDPTVDRSVALALHRLPMSIVPEPCVCSASHHPTVANDCGSAHISTVVKAEEHMSRQKWLLV